MVGDPPPSAGRAEPRAAPGRACVVPHRSRLPLVPRGALAGNPRSTPGRLAGGVPGLLGSRALLDRHHVLRPLPAEPLQVQVLDELRQRRLPRLLIMVVELADLLRI